MLWLTYIIHVTLTENEEDAASIRQAPRVSEFLKACASSYLSSCCNHSYWHHLPLPCDAFLRLAPIESYSEAWWQIYACPNPMRS